MRTVTPMRGCSRCFVPRRLGRSVREQFRESSRCAFCIECLAGDNHPVDGPGLLRVIHMSALTRVSPLGQVTVELRYRTTSRENQIVPFRLVEKARQCTPNCAHTHYGYAHHSSSQNLCDYSAIRHFLQALHSPFPNDGIVTESVDYVEEIRTSIEWKASQAQG